MKLDDHRPIAEINIIPFVDIILVILIIFMVTVPFIIKTGLSLDLPKASSSKALPDIKHKLHITINTAGQVLLNGTLTEGERIKESLKNHIKDMNLKEVQALISADKNVLHGKVISVINIVKSLGLKKWPSPLKNPSKFYTL